MHVDYLNVTVPETDAPSPERAIRSILAEVGAESVKAGLWKLQGSWGSFKLEPVGKVRRFSASGGVLDAVRAAGLYGTFLAAFQDVPHRVTLMDVAHDVAGADAPSAVMALKERIVSGPGVGLTRKRLRPGQFHFELGVDHQRRETGTVYLGQRTAEVRARIYDKGHEMRSKGRGDPGDLLRYELTVTGKVGVSLKDASVPEPLFWHYMRHVLTPPEGVADWVPGGLGYALPPKIALLPAEALRRKVENSTELESWGLLADSLGPQGRVWLLGLLRKRLSIPNQPSSMDSTPDVRALSTGS